MRKWQGADVAEASKGVLLSPPIGFALLVPLLILIGLFFFGPLLVLLFEIFHAGIGSAAEILHGILSKKLFQVVAIRTFRISVIVTTLTIVIGYAMAYAIWRSSPRVRMVALTLVMFPLFTSIVVRTYAWTTVFSRNGVLNTLLLELGIIDAPLRMLKSEPAVLVGMIQVMLPFAILPIYTILLRLDLDLLRASAIAGARSWQTFLNIVVPLTKQGTIVASVLVFVVSLGFFITPAILGGPRSLMISNLISTEVTTFFNLEGGAAMSVLLLVVTIALLMALSRIGSVAAHFKGAS